MSSTLVCRRRVDGQQQRAPAFADTRTCKQSGAERLHDPFELLFVGLHALLFTFLLLLERSELRVRLLYGVVQEALFRAVVAL